MPGAWAPSTRVSIPRASSSRTRRAIGRTSAVGLVTWLMTTRRVRGVTAAMTAATISSSPAVGNGSGASTTRAPSRSATARIVFRMALYSWSLVSSSSPGSKRSERSTAFTPVVAFGTKTSPVGSAPRKAPSARARCVEMPLQLTVQELDRSALHPVPPLALDGQDRLRTGAERAVVQERDVGIQAPAEVGAHRQGMIVSPSAATTGGSPAARAAALSQRASPCPDDLPRLAGRRRDDDAGPLGEADEPEIGRHGGAVAGDRPVPGRGVGMGRDPDPRDDPEARHSAVSRPGPRRERHRARAGAGEHGPARVGALHRGPGRRPRVERRDDVRVAARQVDERRPWRGVRRGTRSAAEAASTTRTGSTTTAMLASAATRRNASTPLDAARSGRPRAAAVGTTATRTIPSTRGARSQDRQQERLVSGQELAAPVERDRPGHGRGSPSGPASSGAVGVGRRDVLHGWPAPPRPATGAAATPQDPPHPVGRRDERREVGDEQDRDQDAGPSRADRDQHAPAPTA